MHARLPSIFCATREQRHSVVFTAEEYTQQLSLSDKNVPLSVNRLFYSLLLFQITFIDCQFGYLSFVLTSERGLQYLPVESYIQLVASSFSPSFQACSMACNNDQMFCIFDYSATLARHPWTRNMAKHYVYSIISMIFFCSKNDVDIKNIEFAMIKRTK
jgi:hypothetical protein